jgi:hypothetical protein
MVTLISCFNAIDWCMVDLINNVYFNFSFLHIELSSSNAL